jgi:WD40 repeat protein
MSQEAKEQSGSLLQGDLLGMERLLRGEIHEASIEALKHAFPKKKLMVFVSSTFRDSCMERNVLHKSILPDLQKKALKNEIQVIFYDMRFGVKEKNTLEHMTWETCKDAILQCCDGSDGLFFLSLQSERYGFLPLPKYLDADVVLEVCQRLSLNPNYDQSKQILDDWYVVDTNNIPPRYELKTLTSLQDSDFHQATRILKDILLDSVVFERLDHNLELRINRSVTEWETLYALNCDKERCYWIQRTFNADLLRSFNGHADSSNLSDVFADPSARKKLEELKTTMRLQLKEGHQCEVLFMRGPADYFCEETCKTYLNEWEKVTRNLLEQELEKTVSKLEKWNKGSAGIPTDYAHEIAHHCLTAFGKARHFFGREELLASALEEMRKEKSVITDETINTLDTDRDHNNENSITTEMKKKLCLGIDAAIVGKSGCGKTSLMSKLALTHAGSNDIPTVIRYCGTSKYSLNGLELIQSISIQILAIYGEASKIKSLMMILPSQEYKAAVKLFQTLISKYPVYLFIDSLDQLENRNEERSKLSFLRDIRPHTLSRIVVSTLPDESDSNGKPFPYFYQCEQVLKAGKVPIIEVGAMHQIEFVMTKILALRRRKLTNGQWDVALNAVSQEPTILYINLAIEVISQWRSFEIEPILKPTVKGLINQIFNELEMNFGKEVTSTAFAMIAFSREGINDIEMKDLLSLHDEVLKEIFEHYPLHCFPIHVWLRLKHFIKNLIVEKDNHCIKWYHRQLWETATERYSEKEKECHRIMGRYFSNLLQTAEKRGKDISDQLLILNEFSVWNSESIVNRRRSIEGFYHLFHSELLTEATDEVCSLEFLCCSALSGDLPNCVRQIGELVRAYGNNEVPQKLNHYYRWVKKKVTRIMLNPRLQVRMTAGEEPIVSSVHKDVCRLYERERTHTGDCLGPLTLGSDKDFDTVEMELTGHGDSIFSVAWNEEAGLIASGSFDCTIKIWERISGELLKTLEGHSKGVTAVAWSPDQTKLQIVSGSMDKTLKVWDVRTGELLNTLRSEGHHGGIRSVVWDDSNRIVSGSWDETIKIWDGSTGHLLTTLTGHSAAVLSVALSYGGDDKIASGSFDKTIKIWDASTSELLATLNGHLWAVNSVSWNRENTKIVSGSEDDTIKIWDAINHELLSTLSGHWDSVTSVAWSHDSRQVLSGSRDKTIKIWDGTSGEQLKTLKAHSSWVTSVCWDSICNTIVSGSLDRTVILWSGFKTELLTATLEGHSGYVRSFFWSSNGNKIASGSTDNSIRIWDIVTGDLHKTMKGCDNTVNTLAWNPDDTKLLSGLTDGTLALWDVLKGELERAFEGHKTRINSVGWSPDGRLIASGSQDKTVKVWDGETAMLLKTLHHPSGVSWVDWNHYGDKIVSGSDDKNIRIWDISQEEILRSWKGHSARITSVAWSHTSNCIVSSSYDKNIKIWESETGTLMKILRGHSDAVKSVALNYDCSKIVSDSWDKTIRIWDALTGKLLNTLGPFHSKLISVFWHPHENCIAFACRDRFIRIWHIQEEVK